MIQKELLAKYQDLISQAIKLKELSETQLKIEPSSEIFQLINDHARTVIWTTKEVVSTVEAVFEEETDQVFD
jgi:hypothetical protein